MTAKRAIAFALIAALVILSASAAAGAAPPQNRLSDFGWRPFARVLGHRSADIPRTQLSGDVVRRRGTPDEGHYRLPGSR